MSNAGPDYTQNRAARHPLTVQVSQPKRESRRVATAAS